MDRETYPAKRITFIKCTENIINFLFSFHLLFACIFYIVNEEKKMRNFLMLVVLKKRIKSQQQLHLQELRNQDKNVHKKDSFALILSLVV